MSNFLDELRDDIGSLGLVDGWSSNLQNVRECQETLDSLGENARRMLEIGIIQDKLVELGFELFNHNGYGADIDKMRLFGTARFEIVFHPTSVFLYHIPPLSEKQAKYTKLDISYIDISYNSTKWQDNVINKVKELIK